MAITRRIGWARTGFLRPFRGVFRHIGRLLLLALSGQLLSHWSAKAAYTAGLAATGKKDFGRAERLYRRAIALKPAYADPFVAMGNTLIGAGRSAEAIPFFEAALRLESGRRDASYGLGMALLTDCRCAEAVRVFRQLTEADPTHQRYYLGLGAALHLSGCLNEAVAAWGVGMEVQAALAKNEGIPGGVRYLPGIFTQALGHLAYIDIWIKRQILKRSPAARYVVLAPSKRIANRAYLDLWREHIEVITGSEPDLASVALHVDDDLTVMRLQDRWMWCLEAGCHIQAEWEEQGRGPLLALSEERKEEARRALEELGLPRDVWFVTLHVRESGFYPAGSALISRRSANVSDYLTAIQKVTEAGGWVVRLGDPSATKLPPLPQVIDYAHCPRRDWLDVYLLAAPRFLIGTNSGPAWAAGTFGVPALLTNWAPFGIQSYFANTVMLPQLLETSTGRRLSLREQLTEPVAWTDSGRRLEQLGLHPVQNTPDEISRAVEDMMARTDQCWKESQDAAVGRMKFHSLLRSMGISGRGTLARELMERYATEFM